MTRIPHILAQLPTDPALDDFLEPAPLPPHDDHLWSIGALLPLVLARYDIAFDPDDDAGSSDPRLTDCVSCR
jgi:hypothetical protein